MCASLMSYQIVTLGLETRWAAHMLLHDGT
jgi:hypothetical protein